MQRALFSFVAAGLLAALNACTSDQNLGARGASAPGDACAQATACCASLTPAVASACSQQLSMAQAQSNAAAACSVLLEGYHGTGLCTGGSGFTIQDGGIPVTIPDASSGEGGSPILGGNGAGAQLHVQSSQQISNVGSYTVPSGSIFVAVALELDDTGTVALPLTTPLFGLVTTTGLQYQGYGITSSYSGGCDPSTSLTAGHSVQCSVVFQTPVDAVSATLSYTLPTGGSVSVPLTTTPCSVCNGVCVDLQSDPKNCGSCGNDVASAGGSCVGGTLACGTLTSCNGACVDTQSDASHCGACGTTCGIPILAPGTCSQGRCIAQKTSTTLQSCDAVCAPSACYSADASYDSTNFSSSSCDSGEFPLASCSTVPTQTIDPVSCQYVFTQLSCVCAG